MAQSGENGLEPLQMLLSCCAKDDDVVNVHDALSPRQATQHLVHEALEGGGRVRETERHHFEAIKPVRRAKRGLVATVLVDFNLPITTGEIECAESCAACECIHAILDTRKRIAVEARDLVQLAVVDTKSNGAVLLLHEHNRECPWTVALLDHVELLHARDLLVDDLAALERRAVRHALDRRMVACVNGVRDERCLA